jgi:RecA-family ATPase
VIPDILPTGLTLFVGDPKVGKSWAVLSWCVAVASGGHAFGSIPVHPGHTLYLALEDNDRRLQRRLSYVTRGDKPPEFFHYSTTEVERIGAGFEQRLSRWLDRRPKARLVVIDTLAMIRPESDGEKGIYEAEYSACKQLLKIAANYDVAIVLVHHSNKSNAADKLARVSGSHGLTGGCDNVFVLTRNREDGSATLNIRGRDIERDGDIPLFWDQRATMWRLENKPETAATAAHTLWRLLRDRPDMSPSEILLASGLGKDQVVAAMSSLKADGVIDIADGRIVVLEA